ncbi:MAG: hypothetical protein AMJ46_10965 [Latescibacteria bacterium DG_63]|nr:MAG: hypothetical protein AMJ46_10965 [Latescibacteria bacterium DG_63]
MHPLAPLMSTNLVLLFHIVPSADWFAATLKRVGSFYRFISAEEIESYYYGNATFNSCCHVCFDDGEKSVYENAFPVLRDMNVPATVFVSPKIIAEGRNYWFQELRHIRRQVGDELLKERICEALGCKHAEMREYRVLSILKTLKLADIMRAIETVKEKDRIEISTAHNMTTNQLLELIDSSVVTIGAHTLNHPILSNESDEDAEREIRESIEQLSKLINKDVRIFSYPNGTALDYGKREQSLLRQHGIRLAVTETVSFFHKSTDPLAIPRAAFSSKGGKNRGILAKIVLLPVWHPLRSFLRPGKTEAKERTEIRDSAVVRSLQ